MASWWDKLTPNQFCLICVRPFPRHERLREFGDLSTTEMVLGIELILKYLTDKKLGWLQKIAHSAKKSYLSVCLK